MTLAGTNSSRAGRAGPVPAGPPAAGRTRLGLCSVTFRRLPAIEVARYAVHAGLEVIEWGADVHAPAGEPGTVRAVREITDRYGLTCCSYGSYFRALPEEPVAFPAIARAAVLLGAQRIRVWAGGTGSRHVLPDERHATVRRLSEAARIAADHGLMLATEFHGNTLTDTVASTLRLLDELGELGTDNVRTYWQPPQDAPDEEALAGLVALGDRVAAVHAFSWWPGNTRLPLADREALWTTALGLVTGRGLDALVEFVPDDNPELLAREAATLRRAAAPSPSGLP
ncbi:sugar phosphate isomerase/epimerase family protein [Streptomyces sp. NPDC050418]|uniref:sugar phosphate isomerase/epimerase family protein n=1 Tax=Streptomyces sp. NPDC050418 TaxID=3365612 RepID=UPI00378BB7DB